MNASRNESPPNRARAPFRRPRVLLSAAYSLLLLSCDSPLAPSEEVIARVEVNPPTLALVAGETRAVVATVTSDGGQTLRDRRIYWSSLNPTVATVSQQGIVSAVATGVTQVAASAGGKSAIVTITVSARPVAVVRVTPSPAIVQVGRTIALGAQAIDAAGGTIGGRPVIWSSSGADVATVSSTGVVTGVGAGTATVTATIDGVAGTAVVTVQPIPVASMRVTPSTGAVVVGSALQLTATPLDANDAPLAGRVVTWGSSNLTIASVSSTGLVNGIAPGPVTITATSEGRSAAATLSVTAVPVDSVIVSPAAATVAAGQTVALSARLADSRGNTLGGRAIAWTSDQPTIATVSTSGVVTGVGTGAARITASSEGKSGTSVVTVTPVPISSIDITPVGGSLVVGGTLQLTAQPRDAQGRSLPGRVVTWITGAPSIASVSRTGLVTAIAPGSAVIFAASEGVSTSVTVNVTGLGVARVTVSPANANVSTGGQVQLTASAADAQGNPVAAPAPAWSSSNDAVATVSSTGRVTGITTGVVTITATIEGVSGTATVGVAAAPVAAVFVSPSSVTVAPGQSQPFLISLADAQGRALPTQGRSVGWSSSNVGVATIAGSGVATAVAPGTTTIRATVDGITGSATLTVAFAQVATLTLVPPNATITVGGTVTLTPLLADAQGNPLGTSGRTITWSALDPSVATVNASGVVTGVAIGANARIVASTPGTGGAKADTSRVTVTNVPVDRVVIAQGTNASVFVGPSFQTTLTAQAFDASNNLLGGRAFTWTSTQQGVAQVGGSTGALTGVTPGTSLIIAVAEGKADTISVDVSFVPINGVTVAYTPATQADSAVVGSSRTLRATPLYNGAPIGATELGGRTPTWRIVSTGSGAASVTASGSDATATGTAAGAIAVEATYGSAAGTGAAALRVLTPVSQIVFQPAPADSIFAGATTSLTAVAVDATNAPIAGRRVDLSSSSPAASLGTTTGTSSVSSVVTGVTPASGRSVATITASAPLDGKSAMRQVTVLSPVDQVIVSALDSMVIGASPAPTATATVRDAAGNTLTGRPLTWSSGASGILTVGATGTLTGVAPGTTPVIATVVTESKSGQKSIKVLEPVQTVALAAARTAIRIGEVLPTTLSLTGSLGSNLTNAGRSVSYTVTPASGVLSVSATGVVTAIGAGSASVVATTVLDGKSSPPVTFTVTPVPITSVSVTAPDSSIFTGQSVQATAVAIDSAGATASLAGRTVVWSSSQASVATVTSGTSGGLITGATVGSSTISVTVDGQGASFALTVALMPVATVTVSPSSRAMIVGDNFTFAVVLRDANGNVLSSAGRTINWTASNGKLLIADPTSGAVLATDSGSVTLTATSVAENVSGTASVTISQLPVSSVGLSSAVTTLDATTTQTTITALVEHVTAGGTRIPLSNRSCSTSSNRTNMLTVSQASSTTDVNGQIAITATRVSVQPGNAPIVTTTCEGVSGSITITVQ